MGTLQDALMKSNMASADQRKEAETETTESLVERFGGTAHGEGGVVDSRLPQKLEPGNKLLIKLSGHIRPVFVWAIYRSRKGHIQAVEVIRPNTGNLDKFRTSNLRLTEDFQLRRAGLRKPCQFYMNAIDIYPYKGLQQNGPFVETGNLGSLDDAFWPDMITRRAHSLCYSPSEISEWHTDINSSWEREGLVFPELSQFNVRSGVLVPEVTPPCQMKNADIGGLDQEKVNNLVRWVVNYNQREKRPGQTLELPKPLQGPESWPYWQEMACNLPKFPGTRKPTP